MEVRVLHSYKKHPKGNDYCYECGLEREHPAANHRKGRLVLRIKWGTQSAAYYGVKSLRKCPVVGQVIQVKPIRGSHLSPRVEQYADGPWRRVRITEIRLMDQGEGNDLFLCAMW